jgi:hypothetical protein
MRKIPTLFVRDPATHFVGPEVTAGCEWVIAGEGTPTRKLDGTSCMVCAGQFWKRREVKPGKEVPAYFELVEVDENTGKTVGWVPVTDGPEDAAHREGMANDGPLPDGTYELVGPKVQGNPEGRSAHRLILHGSVATAVAMDDLTFDGIRSAVQRGYRDSHQEGVVWWHPDGRMAKIKAKDFSHEAHPDAPRRDE